VRDVLIGAVELDEDPAQQGAVKDEQSKEISGLCKMHGSEAWHEVPIGKQHRHLYWWMASAIMHGKNLIKRYTCNEHMMAAVPQFPRREDNTCDICGASCTEELYEFRCVARRGRGETMATCGERRLHPFRAYVSKKCGRGMLGVQTESSKLVEKLTDIVSGENAVSELRELWAIANSTHRRLIEEKLRYLARTELGESEKQAELRKVERIFGALDPKAVDMFRAFGRVLAPHVFTWEVAAVTVYRLGAAGALPQDGYLGEVAKSMIEQQPLPHAPVPWEKPDVVECLNQLSKVLPLRVKLHDILQDGPIIFEPQALNAEAVITLDLVYVSGCYELHGLREVAREPVALSALKSLLKDDIEKARMEYKSRQELAGRRGPNRAQDASVIIPDGEIQNEHITATLNAHTWPPCYSRPNVTPDGALYISAFCMGLVLNYHQGLMCSRHMKANPRLLLLIASWFNSKCPGFVYTTIQLNRNYSAKMHVDGNNHGWSMIIGLGDYEGGDLWIYDPEGAEKMQVKDPLRGYPELKPGTWIPGKRVNIKNKFVKFDGNQPHAALPFDGTRMSLVFFTRKKWTEMKPEYRREALEYGIKVPEDSYLTEGTDINFRTKIVRQGVEKLPEDEPEEEEMQDARLQFEEDDREWRAADWPTCFKKHLHVNWGPKAVLGEDSTQSPLRLVTCCTGPGAAFALQDLVSQEAVKLVAAAETNTSAVKMMKQKEHFKDPVLFSSPDALIDGKGYDELRHDTRHAPVEADIFMGCFLLEPFLNTNTALKKASVTDDPRAQPFRQQVRYLEKHKPPIALLFVTDWDELQPKQRAKAVAFLLDGVDEKNNDKWGLRYLEGYSLELSQLMLQDFGLPLAGRCAFIALVRVEGAGGRNTADAVVHLTRTMAGILPRVRLQEMLLHKRSKYLQEIQSKEWAGTKSKSKSKDMQAQKPYFKRLVNERNELALKEHSHPYYDHICNICEMDTKDWYPHGSDYQKAVLEIVWERARRSGMDLESLVVDLSQDLKMRKWRDDGLLEGVGPHYVFAVHRPLTGREELQCSGFPVDRVSYKGLKDSELLSIPLTTVPVTIFGAALVAALAVSSRKGLQGNKEHITSLIQASKDAMKSSDPQAATFADGTTTFAPEDSEGAQFEGRAATLLNLLHHTDFAQGAAPVRQLKTEKVTRLLATLDKAAMEEPPDEMAEFQASATSATLLRRPTEQETFDNPREWGLRLRKITYGNPPPPVERILKWMQEAVEDWEANLAEKIFQEGCAKIWDRFLTAEKKDGSLADTILKQICEVKEVIEEHTRDAGPAFRRVGEEFFTRVDERLVRNAFLYRDTSKAIEAAVEQHGSMDDYIDKMRRELKTWTMRRCFIDHLPRGFNQHASAYDAFEAADGVTLVTDFLQYPLPGTGFDKEWGIPRAEKTLHGLTGKWPQLLPAVYALAEQAADKSFADRLATHVREEMVQLACKALEQATNSTSVKAFKALGLSAGANNAACKRMRSSQRIIDQVLWSYNEAQGVAAGSSDLLTKIASALDKEMKDVRNDEASQEQHIVEEFMNDKEWAKLYIKEDGVYQECRRTIVARITELNLQKRIKEDEELKRQKLDAERERAESERKLAEEADKTNRLQAETKAHQVLSGEEAIPVLLEIAKNLTCSPQGKAQEDGVVQEALILAKKKVEKHFKTRVVIMRAKGWLHEQGLGECVPMLEDRNLLSDLWDLPKNAHELTRLGLPQHCRKALEAKLATLRERELLDGSLPCGWSEKTSTSNGCSYYCHDDGRVQYECPDESIPLPNKVPPKFREPPKAGNPKEGGAVYIEFVGGRIICRLCNSADVPWSHFAETGHKRLQGIWDDQLAQSALAPCCKELAEVVAHGCPNAPGLATAWYCELDRLLQEQVQCMEPQLPRPQGQYLIALFWHRIVLPFTKSMSANAGARHLWDAFTAMLERASLPEPKEQVVLPVPCVDFPYYTPAAEMVTFDDSSPDEAVQSLTAKDLRCLGLKRRESTGPVVYECIYCDMQGITELHKHLLPHYNEAKTHYKYRDMSVGLTEDMKTHGWKLRHQGITIRNKQFNCTVCGGSGDWYNYVEHTATKAHIKNAATLPAKPTEAEARDWAEIFRRADEKLKHENLLEPPKAPAPVPAKPLKRAQEESLPPCQGPRPQTHQRTLPPLPSPRNDFPGFITSEEQCLKIAENTPESRIRSLSGRDLSREGIVATNGKRLWCYFCEAEVDDLVRHLVPLTREAKSHNKNRAYSVEVVRRIVEEGWRFPYEGISIKGFKFKCEACGKADQEWYKCFEHLETGDKHAKYRSYNDSIPKMPQGGVPDAERQAWASLVSLDPAVGLPSSSVQSQPAVERTAQQAALPAAGPGPHPVAAKRPPGQPDVSDDADDTPPPSKRHRAQQPDTSERLPRPPNIEPRVPNGLQWEKAPSNEDLQAMVIRAKNKCHPELPPPLCWGKDVKKNGLWIWCRECEKWVGWVLIKWEQRSFTADPDGSCGHWTAAAKQRCEADAKRHF